MHTWVSQCVSGKKFLLSSLYIYPLPRGEKKRKGKTHRGRVNKGGSEEQEVEEEKRGGFINNQGLQPAAIEPEQESGVFYKLNIIVK